MRAAIERIVAEIFGSSIPGLQDELTRRVADHLAPLSAELEASGALEKLRAALAVMREASAQSDILRALLDGAAAFCGRTALFIPAGNSASGWQARGFAENDAVKLVVLDLSQGLASRAMHERRSISGPATDFDQRMYAELPAPYDGDCSLFPLLIRDRVTALVYADAGTQSGAEVEAAALEILVNAAATWIELVALRRLTLQAEGLGGESAQEAERSPAREPATREQRAAEPSPPPPAAGPAEGAPMETAASVSTGPEITSMYSGGAQLPGPAPLPAAAGPPPGADEEELHRKARRFARLLADEIRLYNQVQVTQGQRQHDLYDRLKEDIERSRTAYEKRYAQTSVAGSGYFEAALVRCLADGDPELMGANFQAAKSALLRD
jgi:hypothetical protein